MRFEINRIDHVADMADVLAVASVGAAMSREDIERELFASIDGISADDDAQLDNAESALREAWRLAADDMVAAAHAVSDDDATADDYPMQLFVFGLRAVLES